MDRSRHVQTVGHVDAHPLAFDRLNDGAVHTAIESPTFGAQTRIEFMIYFFGNEMENFDSVDNLERERRAVWNDDGFVTAPRKNRRQRFNIDGSAAIAFLPIRPIPAARRVITPERPVIRSASVIDRVRRALR